ncbi:Stk1 family PASTA domain-containing Ser/Thr kinase [Paenibacillus sp. Leaf72]|uniref:Stk1 family PASTA domain-containing Ser/Thr kinase n=1 Tax=Paenibacillus sp. Leaf72 TaxID=1736234 RepID=UPI0006F6AFEB|nr:Stk1 family PASTA domain-containing Ser/Thr kinase [Paenibacillus sp. Leaf72]KQO04522.1 serine/threonine protein kinase [Paenibacillus sp. Leaf72]
MIGHNLGGRYEILTRIGGGGMALVYKAHDVLLNRNVAVKVLRQQFVHDEEFIRRFRREAQSAAALSHPNVVSIYDVGQEEDTHYIVMEYIEGSNLNEIIVERAPLQADESVRIAIQICDALGHAHQNHIIHRDIKPHNILIGKNGRVKVTDFGIARAVTSSTITQTGSVLGSVHYFSPEHAKGVSTGEKSDLYSLGIVLYQMLTGNLPFLGESPISVALKHLQDTFEEPRVVNPHIPQSVENVILRAMRKNPGERYHSAQEMLNDLETCLAPNRRNEEKVSFAHVNDLDETRVMPAIRGSDIRPIRQSESSYDKAEVSSGQTGRQGDKEVLNKKAKGWKRPTIIVASTLVVLAFIIWGFVTLLDRLDVEEVDVPYVVGLDLEQATAELKELGLKVQEPTIREYRDDIPVNQVFEQTKRNMRVKQGSFIQLSVSDGPMLKKLGDYRGKTLQAVKDELSALGIDPDTQIDVEEVFSEQEVDTVVTQQPEPGKDFDPNTVKFQFMVSKGMETIKMPNLIGKTVAEAKDMVKANGLTLSDDDILYEPSYVQAKGLVLNQDQYKPNDLVPKGTKITIRVSSGPSAEAKEHQFNVVISPAKAGKTSEIRIVYTDSRGQNIEWGRNQIQDTQTFPVTVVLAPNTEAMITIYRDSQFVDTKSVTYDQLAQSSSSSTVTVPGEDEQVTTPVTEEPVVSESPAPEPTVEPDQSEVNNGNDQGSDQGKAKGKDKGKDEQQP